MNKIFGINKNDNWKTNVWTGRIYKRK
jgi:hypothetical protein